MLIALLGAAIVLIAFLLIRHGMLKRELRRMAVQLEQYNDGVTQKRLDLLYFQRDLERLAAEINRQMERVTLTTTEKARVENELRQAVANISHDLRTPLTSIFGYMQMLEKEDLPPEDRRRYFDIVNNRTSRLRALLDDFFELSVIESVDYALKLERIDLARLLPEILLDYYDRFVERQLEPEVHLPDTGACALADEAAVRRVAENLVLNTLRHAGSPVVIRLEARDNAVVLEIRNRAPGLVGTDVARLFDRFHMADRTRSTSGSGLGLPIARSLMHKMNGALEATMIGDELRMTAVWKSV